MSKLNPSPILFEARTDARRISTQVRHLTMDALWVTLGIDRRTGLQNFTPALVDELQNLVNSLRTEGNVLSSSGDKSPLPYTVIQSQHPEYFSMGGDLQFFRQCIQRSDASRLHDYSMRCLNLLFSWAAQLKERTTSIALVQGRALGGGFELALSTDHLIAEEQSTFGFPEIMFGLFPCTGAMGLLANVIGARQAERMMTNKKIYTARELFEMGLIDEICPQGQGELAVERYIQQHASRLKARMKVQQSRYRQAPLNYEDGVQIVDDWVETAMRLSADELRTLDMLAMLQQREASDGKALAA